MGSFNYGVIKTQKLTFSNYILAQNDDLIYLNVQSKSLTHRNFINMFIAMLISECSLKN